MDEQPKVKIITAWPLMQAICAALNIPERGLRRMVLDLAFDDACMIYTEHFGTEPIKAIDWNTLLSNARIVEVGTGEAANDNSENS